MNTNKYPIYVISKGRWERRQTVKTLESMNICFKIVIEPSEQEFYKKVIDNKKIIVTPENFSEMKQGSIPVRNFVFDLSTESGFKRHWILDDNIESVERYNKNMKVKCKSVSPFVACEDFTDRYKNVALSGMNYASFCPASDARAPFQINTRVYSCILINNKIPFRWRGKFNEDTDLSLRCLKSGWNTILFNAFLIGKRATMCQAGGNDAIYKESNDRFDFAKSLRDQHLDVVKIVRRFNRWHHQVDYSQFKKRQLEYIDGYKIPENKVNNYGMVLCKRNSDKPKTKSVANKKKC